MRQPHLFIVYGAPFKEVVTYARKLSGMEQVQLYDQSNAHQLASWAFPSGSQEYLNYRSALRSNSILNSILASQSLVVPLMDGGLDCTSKVVNSLMKKTVDAGEVVVVKDLKSDM